MRIITLPAINKRVSLAVYVKAIKLAKKDLNQEFKHGLTTWWPTLGKEIVAQFMEGVQERINDNVSYINRK